MSKNHDREFESLINKDYSGFGVRKFVSDAICDEGMGTVRHQRGLSIYRVRYVTDIPSFSELIRTSKESRKAVSKKEDWDVT